MHVIVIPYSGFDIFQNSIFCLRTQLNMHLIDNCGMAASCNLINSTFGECFVRHSLFRKNVMQFIEVLTSKGHRISSFSFSFLIILINKLRGNVYSTSNKLCV